MVRKVAKNVPRNQKKYWRKISTKEIDDKLDDLRVQEITGGLRAEQPDHLLYHIDTEITLGADSVEQSSKKKKREERSPLDLNNLNNYKILKPHSAVAPIGNDSRQKADPSSKSTKRLIEAQETAEKRRSKRKKYQRAKEQRSEAEEKKQLKMAEKFSFDDPNVQPTFDLWNVKDEKKEKVRKIVGPKLASFIEQVHQEYDWQVPSHITNKPSKLPAIEKPLPGTSYNPTYEEHQNLLRRAVEVEVEKIRKEEKLDRTLPKAVPLKETIELKKNWMNEMSSGLFDDETSKNDETTNLTSISVGKPVKVETKTVQQRNKEKLRKKEEASAKAKKEKRIREHQLSQMKSIRKKVQNELVEQKKRQEKRKIEFEQRENFGTKKFGRYKFEEADLDLNLSDEITGNLRTMKAEGNILFDRFKSFQKRNIIETRIRAKPTKTKMKKYEKRSVREVGEKYRPK